MQPKILFEDEDLLVVDKPSGLTVNKSDTTANEETLQDFIEKKNKDLLAAADSSSEFKNRAGIVHRLDKETSGVLIVAKNKQAFEALQGQFKERKVEKVYLALAHGALPQKEGEISVPVGRLPWNRKRFGVLAGGREATTFYKALKEISLNGETLSLLEVYPKTGRTHQIRVHLKHVGHPIFADPLYSGRKTARNDRKILPRVFLHASKIKFIHPITGEKVEIEAPLPKELESILD